MTASRWRAATTLAAWTALLIASMTWVVRLPPTPAGLSEGIDAAATTMTIVRFLTLGLGGYLLGVTAMALAVHVLHLPRMIVRAVEPLAPSAVRSLVRAVVGVTLTASVASAPTYASAASAAPASAESEAPDEPVLMHRLPDVDAGPPPEPPPPGPRVSSGEGTRVVRPGDHFWSIAESELGAVRGGPVRDAEVDPYWRLLVAANRELTADPDLLVPGQVVRLPPVP